MRLQVHAEESLADLVDRPYKYRRRAELEATTVIFANVDLTKLKLNRYSMTSSGRLRKDAARWRRNARTASAGDG